VAATFGSNAAATSTTTMADPSLLTDDTISLQADHHPSTKAESNTSQDSSYAVLAHVAPNLVFRANTVAAYLYANKVEQSRGVLPNGATYNAKFRSVVLPNCTIGDKVTFQTTVVGKNCTLGHKCRLNNVVLMDHVVIGDNTILQNTIVGRGSVIGDNCNLNDCQVAPHATLPTGTKKKGEALMEGDFAAS
jgi:NDP-sugar pyrophosphorylase family protein